MIRSVQYNKIGGAKPLGLRAIFPLASLLVFYLGQIWVAPVEKKYF